MSEKQEKIACSECRYFAPTGTEYSGVGNWHYPIGNCTFRLPTGQIDVTKREHIPDWFSCWDGRRKRKAK